MEFQIPGHTKYKSQPIYHIQDKEIGIWHIVDTFHQQHSLLDIPLYMFSLLDINYCYS